MKGKSEAEAEQELRATGMDDKVLKSILPHKVFEGNRPSNSIIVPQVSPFVLGLLIGVFRFVSEHDQEFAGISKLLNALFFFHYSSVRT